MTSSFPLSSITPKSYPIRTMFIQTGTTPNPHSLKFIPDAIVLQDVKNSVVRYNRHYIITRFALTAIIMSRIFDRMVQKFNDLH